MFSVFQEMTLTQEAVENSEECTQELLSSWAEAVNEHGTEERFEMYSQESRTDFESS